MSNWPPSARTQLADSSAKPPDHGTKSPDLSVKSPDLTSEPPDLPTEHSSYEKSGKALGGKSKDDDLLDVAVLLLKWRELTLAQMADYLGRSEDHIRKTYLHPTTPSGQSYGGRIPEKINDPNQNYRAVR